MIDTSAIQYEGLPRDGYAAVFKRMLSSSNIRVELNTDFHDLVDRVSPRQMVVYTGAIDRFFEYRCGRLGWRTLRFEREVLPTDDFQGTSVMNYADIEIPFTRIHEFKHLHPERRYQPRQTLIASEFSRFASPNDEPYYPIATSEDKTRFAAYKELARDCPQRYLRRPTRQLQVYRHAPSDRRGAKDVREACCAFHQDWRSRFR